MLMTLVRPWCYNLIYATSLTKCQALPPDFVVVTHWFAREGQFVKELWELCYESADIPEGWRTATCELDLQLSLYQPTNLKRTSRNRVRNKWTLAATKEIRLPEMFVAWQPYQFIFIFLNTGDRSDKLPI
jgi:hypothetical protein